jgi:hypothetical protein
MLGLAEGLDATERLRGLQADQQLKLRQGFPWPCGRSTVQRLGRPEACLHLDGPSNHRICGRRACDTMPGWCPAGPHLPPRRGPCGPVDEQSRRAWLARRPRAAAALLCRDKQPGGIGIARPAERLTPAPYAVHGQCSGVLSASRARSSAGPRSSASSPLVGAHSARTERRVGRPACPLHATGNHHPIER